MLIAEIPDSLQSILIIVLQIMHLQQQNALLDSYLVELERFATNLLVLGNNLIFQSLDGFFENFLALVDFLNFLSLGLEESVLFVQVVAHDLVLVHQLLVELVTL